MLEWIPTLMFAFAGVGAEASSPAELEVFFEAKLLVRRSARGRRVEVDQWSGGRLLMRGTDADDGAIDYRISEILESPWTFRWYPSRDEVKLGAAVWVERPTGDPYGSLAPRLEQRARRLHGLWWDADPPVPGPDWAASTGRFWARRHATEVADKDELPEDPTYPFHVLGALGDRFGFTLRDGSVEDVVETMTRPWLADGWAAAREGRPVEGYGFWGRERPRWEPRTYETFAAALRLLAASDEPVRGLWRVVTTMQPLAARLEVDALAPPKVWRARDAGAHELQLFATDGDDETIKVWVRVGFREAPPRKP